jgi:hypothetical protein
MSTNAKFVITVTGPLMMYRLDLMKKSSPNIVKDYLIVFTDKYSHEVYEKNGYSEHFNFVIMDEIRRDYPISLEYERLLESPTEEDYLMNIRGFYNREKNRYYPYDIHRFILPYMAKKGILNFALICSDFILNNDLDIAQKYFDRIKPGSTYIHWLGEDVGNQERRDFFNKEIQPLFPHIKFDLPFYRNADGFIRGFHFKNESDAVLLFEVWNKCIEKLFTDYSSYLGPHLGDVIQDTTWVCPYVMQYFQNLGYEFFNSSDLLYINETHAGIHLTRPEDTFYLGPRWVETENFNYSDTGSISSFIRNNKKQLKSYYDKHTKSVEITDTHVYTKIERQ